MKTDFFLFVAVYSIAETIHIAEAIFVAFTDFVSTVSSSDNVITDSCKQNALHR